MDTEQVPRKNCSRLILLLCGLSSGTVLGQSNSSSTSYDLLQASATGGGGQVSNGSGISAEISIGSDLGGAISDLTTGGVQEKPNFIGQLYDVTVLTPGATPATVDEGGTRQLVATATLDDHTLLVLTGNEVQWSILLGPLTGIDTSGLASAGLVHEDRAATAQGVVQGVSGPLVLTVLNTDPDNFGSYGGDGLPDDWQIDFFGTPPNPDADPGANPDQDPHNNRFEFLTGYDPTDPGDFFTFGVIDLAGSTSTLALSKIIPGTRYRIERSVDLERLDPWTEFTIITTPTEVIGHQLPDPGASGPHWFYRVGVESE